MGMMMRAQYLHKMPRGAVLSPAIHLFHIIFFILLIFLVTLVAKASITQQNKQRSFILWDAIMVVLEMWC